MHTGDGSTHAAHNFDAIASGRSPLTPLSFRMTNYSACISGQQDRAALELRDDRIPAVDDDGLPRDEVVVGDQANDGLRNVVGRRNTTERRPLGAALHQTIVVGTERGVHPPP